MDVVKTCYGPPHEVRLARFRAMMTGVPREEFLRERSAFVGTENPTPIESAYKVAAVRTQLRPSAIHEVMGFEEPDLGDRRDPTWTYDRIGMPTVLLSRSGASDGSPPTYVVSFGGEHEDWADPNFRIYNDVVWQDFLGNVLILQYPTDVFPPTDFHTATLWPPDAPREVVLIGNLGYSKDHDPARTQVVLFSLSTCEMERLHVEGPQPGWIHHHMAIVSGDSIRAFGGERATHDGSFVKNLETWDFDPERRRWTKAG